MSDYPMLISNKLHSFRNFIVLIYIKEGLPRVEYVLSYLIIIILDFSRFDLTD